MNYSAPLLLPDEFRHEALVQIATLLGATANDVTFVPQALFSTDEFLMQVVHIRTADIP